MINTANARTAVTVAVMASAINLDSQKLINIGCLPFCVCAPADSIIVAQKKDCCNSYFYKFVVDFSINSRYN